MNLLKKLVLIAKQFFINVSIRYKILIVFMAFLMFYMIISAGLYFTIIDKETKSQVRQRSLETTELIDSNISALVENANNISKMMSVNSIIRNYLTSTNPSVVARKQAYEFITNIHMTSTNIDSIFLFDLYGSNIKTVKYLTLTTFEDVRSAPWFEEILDMKGKYKISINADNTLYLNNGKNVISLIKILNDINTLKPIGVLILNIQQESISEILKNSINSDKSFYVIVDKNNNAVIKDDPTYTIFKSDLSNLFIGEYIIKHNKENYFKYIRHSESPDWKIVGFSRLSYSYAQTNTLKVIYMGLIVLTLIVFVFASLLTGSLITSPIKKLIKSMQGVSNGIFKRVSYKTGNDEIGELKDTYNIMIKEINDLIIQLINEEKEKRKFELDVLNEQIKPHFLYNTLDSIAYLALTNNDMTVYNAITSLGRFCRTSLSKGTDFIPFEEELKMIKNYLSLQNLRYGDIITDLYDVSKEALSVVILKNILQPLIENCIYHGIRPSGEAGIIKICAYVEDGFLMITVSDNGIGMNSDTILSISDLNLLNNQSSFGLRGTIQRLKIHYAIGDIYQVESKLYEGTVITLRIPTKETTTHGERTQSINR